MRVIGNASVAAAAQLRRSAPRPAADAASRGSPSTTARRGDRGPRSPAPVRPSRPGPAEAQPEPSPSGALDELLAELDALIGLERVKREVHRQVAVLRVEKLRADAGLKSPTITRHLVFTGNPGTGKTTVARLVSGIYQALGLLSKGQLVEVDRSELVAGYLGQTATKTAEVGRVGRGRGAVHRRGLQPDRPRAPRATSTARRPSTRWSRRWRTGATTWSSSSPATPRRWRRSSPPTPDWPAGSGPRSSSRTTATTSWSAS